MIISIKGPQRCGKSLLAGLIAKNIKSWAGIDIIQGFGNMSVYKCQYPYTYMSSKATLDRLFEVFTVGTRNSLCIVDEAHRILNARVWKHWSYEDTFKLSGIFQDEKLSNVLIYTFVPGKPDDEMKGVDIMLRSACMLDILIKSSKVDIEQYNFMDFQVTDWCNYDGEDLDTVDVYEHHIADVSQFFPIFNTLEPVV